jgi:hypothetical protein
VAYDTTPIIQVQSAPNTASTSKTQDATWCKTSTNGGTQYCGQVSQSAGGTDITACLPPYNAMMVAYRDKTWYHFYSDPRATTSAIRVIA